MRKIRSRSGFTMAELLIVIAIIGVLSSVAFISYNKTQRDMAQLERDSIAKEIFIAAQNHLTLAKSQDYNRTALSTDAMYGTKGEADADTGNPDIYYFAVVDGSGANDTSTVLGQMLPFGAVEENVRAGNYIIRYQPKAALVLDVFYWDKGGRYSCSSLSGDDYITLMNTYRGESQHKTYPSGVLGWFGGQEAVASGAFLEAPGLEVINAERLIVKVTDKNIISNAGMEPMLKLLISNKAGTVKCALLLTHKDVSGQAEPMSSTGGRLYEINTTDPNAVTYTIVLDDITQSGMKFADFEKDSSSFGPIDVSWAGGVEFVPGEDIVLQAVAYSNDKLTNIAYSGEWLTNSLYEEIREEKKVGGTTEKVARIANIRHLENLSDAISSVDNDDENALFDRAVQTVDLDWNDFKTKIGGDVAVYDSADKASKTGCFQPVSPTYALKYDGQTSEGEEPSVIITNHVIKNIEVDNSGGDATISAGGVFGTLVSGSSIQNLELIDTKVTMTGGPAGALAGSLKGSTVTNVVAHNTAAFETDLCDDDPTMTTVASAGDVGGLVGVISDDTSLKKCAAALIVMSTGGNAGGLVGSASGTGCEITACYSGGHTVKQDEDSDSSPVVYSTTNYNVTGAKAVGGLIGLAGSTTIQNSYSTCSAKTTGDTDAKAGGLAGAASGQITNCYCTGLVGATEDSAKTGTFAGSFDGTATGCLYFEIINESPSDAEGFTYLAAVGDGSGGGITALDASAKTYENFCGADSTWQDALPYKADALTEFYGESSTEGYTRYNLKTAKQLDPSVKETDFVAVHYGDWPVPEIFITNTNS